MRELLLLIRLKDFSNLDKMNKKGMLLASETLKIVVAAICIGFLIYLLSALYFANSDKKSIEEASGQLEKIKVIINNFDSGNLSGDVYALAPNDWGIYSFNQGEIKPNACANVNCICFCEDVYDDFFNGQFKKCNKQSVCLANERFLEFEDIEFVDGGKTSIKISKENGRILVKVI